MSAIAIVCVYDGTIGVRTRGAAKVPALKECAGLGNVQVHPTTPNSTASSERRAGVLSARPTGAQRLSVAICCWIARVQENAAGTQTVRTDFRTPGRWDQDAHAHWARGLQDMQTETSSHESRATARSRTRMATELGSQPCQLGNRNVAGSARSPIKSALNRLVATPPDQHARCPATSQSRRTNYRTKEPSNQLPNQRTVEPTTEPKSRQTKSRQTKEPPNQRTADR